MVAILESLQAAADRGNAAADQLIALSRTQAGKIQELLDLVKNMPNVAEENRVLKEGMAVIRDSLLTQAGETEAALVPPGSSGE